AGRRAAKDCAYEVRYALQSFQIVGPPVHEAGSAIVMRLSISGGDPGTNIFAPGYPQTIQVDCNTGVRIGAPQSANLIGGTHDLGGGNFQFELKTDLKATGCLRPVLGKSFDAPQVPGVVIILVNGKQVPRGG